MDNFDFLVQQWEKVLLDQEDSLLIVGGDCITPAHEINNCKCYGTNNCNCGCRMNNCDCYKNPKDLYNSNNCYCGGDCGPNKSCGTNPCVEPPKVT